MTMHSHARCYPLKRVVHPKNKRLEVYWRAFVMDDCPDVSPGHRVSSLQ